jgi:glycosyltransferase involved in cell wall biosynthesis
MPKSNFFICPASNYLNKFNETGSIGQISYEFLKALSEQRRNGFITAIVFNSFKVESFDNVTVQIEVHKTNFSGIDSLKFYLITYIKYVFSSWYKNAEVVHHFQPFAKELTFNLFFLIKNRRKKYILGPLIGPHVNGKTFTDEDFILSNKSEVFEKVSNKLKSLFQGILRYANRLTIQNSDLVWFSDTYAYDSFKHSLKPDQDYAIWGIGVDLNTFNRKEVARSNEFTILFCGRLTERKGCEFLIRAIGVLYKENGNIQIKCIVVGFGVLEKKLRQLADSLGINHLIKFTGGVESNHEIVDYYNQSDVFCIPALSDTWISAKEALCCGLPVIITDVGAHASHIDDGFNGFLVKPENPEEIARKVSLLMNDNVVLNRMKDNAYKSRIKYDWNNILGKYLQYVEN